MKLLAALAVTLVFSGTSFAAKGKESPVVRGGYLVRIGGCHDCHTPMKMGPKGPEPDMTRMLSGHPEQMKMPPAPPLPEGPWGFVGSHSLTAFAGPWGTSFAANLTPDPETGLGRWTEAQFLKAMKTGRHEGKGRPILPPMPWQNLAAAKDDDLKAIFAYLGSIPAMRNAVPAVLPPPAPAAAN